MTLSALVRELPPRPGLIDEFASRQGKAIIDYVKHLDAKVAVVEEDYIDRDYLIDYQEFYSRSFSDVSRRTKRIHFFKAEFTEREFNAWLDKGGDRIPRREYLGFAVVKPVRDKEGYPLIGTTILQSPSISLDPSSTIIEGHHEAHLFGMPIPISGLPFQVQDSAVSACATIALWTAMQALAETYPIVRHAPSEITIIAGDYPGRTRTFPSTGLSMPQVVTYLRAIGLDYEFIAEEHKHGREMPMGNELASQTVKAYIRGGIPILASLKLSQSNEHKEYHVATIVGYHSDRAGAIDKLFVHDDQIAPYALTLPVNGRLGVWMNSWGERGYKVFLEEFLIPIYPKVRMDFHSIVPYAGRLLELYMKEFRLLKRPDYELFLTTVQKYKKALLTAPIVDRETALKKSLPRFLWVVRLLKNGKATADYVIDGTSTTFNIPLVVSYLQRSPIPPTVVR